MKLFQSRPVFMILLQKNLMLHTCSKENTYF